MQFFPALSHTIAFLPFSHSILLLSFHSSFHLTCQFSIFGFTLTPFPPLHLPAFLPARNIFVSKHNVSIYLSLSHFLIFFLFLSVPLLFRVPLLSSTVVSNFLHFDFLFASPLECVFRFALHNPFQWHLHLVFLLLFPPLQLSNYNFPLGEGGGGGGGGGLPSLFGGIIFVSYSEQLPSRSSVPSMASIPTASTATFLARITISMDSTSRVSISLSVHCDIFCHVFHYPIPSIIVKTADTAEDTSVLRQRLALSWLLNICCYNIRSTIMNL